LGGFELEVLESYEVALRQNFTAWMMVIGNEDRQDRLPAAVGVICASDTNDVETRVLSPEEQQQINNIISQITQVTSIDQVINIISNINNNATNQNATGGAGGGTAPPPTSPDTTRPTLTVPDDMTLQTGGGPTALLVYSVTAQDDRDGAATLDEDNQLIQGDNVGGSIFISCRPHSQYFLPVGNRTVECFAADAVNNTARALFTVSVRGPTSPAGPIDTTPPVLTVPPNSVATTNDPAGLSGYRFEVFASDNVDGAATLDEDNQLMQSDIIGGIITISCNPNSGAAIPIGTNTFQCNARDEAGNRGTASFTVTVNRGDDFKPLIEEQPLIEEEGAAPPAAEEQPQAAPEEEPTIEEEEDATSLPANEGEGG
jgi:hypothetical protein